MKQIFNQSEAADVIGMEFLFSFLRCHFPAEKPVVVGVENFTAGLTIMGLHFHIELLECD